VSACPACEACAADWGTLLAKPGAATSVLDRMPANTSKPAIARQTGVFCLFIWILLFDRGGVIGAILLPNTKAKIFSNI
jgi:hypothetical protein